MDDIIMSPVQHGCQADLQVVLDKHRNDILCLLRTKSPSKQGAIPQHMRAKIHKVNMGSMVKINDQFAQAGGKALTVMKLKELGSKAEREARELYTNLGDGGILPTLTNALIPHIQLPSKVHPGIEEVWQSLLPHGSHINSMDPDRNCLFRSLSDQLNNDNGYAHAFTRHQITNHI